MAGSGGFSAAGRSIERLLDAHFVANAALFQRRPRAVLVRSNDFSAAGTAESAIQPPCLSVFFYRAEVNKTMRAAWSGVGSLDGSAYLPVDLHFAIAAWDENAEYELRILGSAMACLETTPILTGPLLHPSGQWRQSEALQIVHEDVPTESLLHLFDSLASDFRLTVPYIARLVRVESRDPVVRPDVATVITGAVPTAHQP